MVRGAVGQAATFVVSPSEYSLQVYNSHHIAAVTTSQNVFFIPPLTVNEAEFSLLY